MTFRDYDTPGTPIHVLRNVVLYAKINGISRNSYTLHRVPQSLPHGENCVLRPKKIGQEADTNRKHCVGDWTLFVSVSDADTNTCHSPNMLQHW